MTAAARTPAAHGYAAVILGETLIAPRVRVGGVLLFCPIHAPTTMLGDLYGWRPLLLETGELARFVTPRAARIAADFARVTRDQRARSCAAYRFRALAPVSVEGEITPP